ncbi:Uncharacterized protein dnm_019070 [Desulfonema magnum]|uniref:Uncharacterized protein n=1 Tax=Desulfonema magnum TaxID=45655 RepID=A0A975GLS2_9BACT|nr:Uncharacterized protein dnm_019070 [Desulfonema magnum]
MCLCGKYKNSVALATKTRRHEENTKKLRETLCLCAFVANIRILFLADVPVSRAVDSCFRRNDRKKIPVIG